jgi:hypothetical protein
VRVVACFGVGRPPKFETGVLEGTARIVNGDETFEATAGAAISLRKGVAHAWGNQSNSPLRLVVTNVPGGIEEALRLIANGADIGAVAEQFAVRVVGPMFNG